MRLHAEVVLVALLGLVHLRIELAVLVLRRTERVNDRGSDDAALAQQQAALAQIAIDDLQNPTGQRVFLQQAAEVEDGGFVRDPIQVQSGKVAQDRHFVESFLHRRIAVAEPVLHKVHTQHGHQRVAGRPLRLSGSTARSTPSAPATARPDPSRSGCAHGESVCACRRTRHRRRSAASCKGAPERLTAYFTRLGSVFQTLLRGII